MLRVCILLFCMLFLLYLVTVVFCRFCILARSTMLLGTCHIIYPFCCFVSFVFCLIRIFLRNHNTWWLLWNCMISRIIQTATKIWLSLAKLYKVVLVLVSMSVTKSVCPMLGHKLRHSLNIIAGNFLNRFFIFFSSSCINKQSLKFEFEKHIPRYWSAWP